MDGRTFPTLLLASLGFVGCQIDPIGAAPNEATAASTGTGAGGGGPPSSTSTGGQQATASASTSSSTASGTGGDGGSNAGGATSSGEATSTGVGGDGGGGAPPVDECAAQTDACLAGERCVDLVEGYDCAPLAVLVLIESEPSRAVATGLAAVGANAIEGPGFGAWDGTNPPLDAVDAVVWFQGVDYTAAMPLAGQLALAEFVTAGGGLVRTEWAALFSSTNVGPADVLLPVVFLGGTGIGIAWNRSLPGHPIGADLPDAYTDATASWSAVAAAPGTDVVWRNQELLPLVVTTSAYGGPVVYVNHAGTFSGGTPIDMSPEAIQIFVDAALFAAR